MCGLVFAAGRHSMVAGDLDVFRKMLMCDTFRGHHSTGVFSYFQPYKHDPFYKVTKDGMDGFDFGRSKLFSEAVCHQTESTYTKGTYVANYAKAVFGHNRHATIGAVNAKNAHPFTHGKITLAHNGTLRDQSLLPDHKNFEVDSDNIAYAMDKLGVDETVKLLNGAYALIWFNAEENTMNFIRNSERPFHFFETSIGDWFGCSEQKMGEWILDREKKTIKRSFSAQVGVHYIFSLDGGCVLKEERKLELPTFPPKVNNWSRWDDDGFYSGKGSGKTGTNQTSQGTSRTPDSVIQDLNISEGTNFLRDREFTFEMFNFKPYIGNPSRGCITGWLPNLTEYVEVQIHNAADTDYEEGSNATATLVSAYVMNHTTHFVAKEPKIKKNNVVQLPLLPNKKDSEVAEEDEPIVIEKTRTGEMFSERGWRGCIHNTCAACSDPIPFSEIGEVEIINGYSFCKNCTDAQDVEYDLEEISEEDQVAALSALLEDLEEEEAPREVLSLKKDKEVSGSDHDRFQGEIIPSEASPEPLVRVNGLFLNEEQWSRINICRCCEERIPFSDVGRITFWGEAPLCYKHSLEMQSMD